MNCFLCHLDNPNLGAWQHSIQSAQPEWAVSATLLGTGLLQPANGELVWNGAELDEDEMVSIAISHARPAQSCRQEPAPIPVSPRAG